MLVFAAMLLLGILLGFVGAGGAGVMITMLSVGFDIPMQVALGTSLAAMTFTSLSGSISHFREGNVNRRLGLLLGAFGAAGAFCGAHISSGLASATLKPLTGVVLMLSAFLIYLRVFHPANPLFSFRFTSCIALIYFPDDFRFVVINIETALGIHLKAKSGIAAV